ncbi:MAG TPA: hypothetical protein VMY87_01535 [Armatimonadota bacterium]|nr:hypothetical protein [Armatimonadota bacterium]
MSSTNADKSPTNVNKHFTPDASFNPIESFTSRKMTRKEKVLKTQIDSYRVSDVDDTAVIYVGNATLPILTSLELPDAECDGLTFKLRVVQTDEGDCLLLARWKPDRYMRRSAPPSSQKWFVEKKLFPPNKERFFHRLERTANEVAEEEG